MNTAETTTKERGMEGVPLTSMKDLRFFHVLGVNGLERYADKVASLAMVEKASGGSCELCRSLAGGQLILQETTPPAAGEAESEYPPEFTTVINNPYQLVGWFVGLDLPEGGVHDIRPRYAEFLRQAEANGVDFGNLLEGLNIVEERAENAQETTAGTGQA